MKPPNDWMITCPLCHYEHTNLSRAECNHRERQFLKLPRLERQINSLRQKQRKLRKALRNCANAIRDEIDAAGTDDVNSTPILLAHQRTMRHADKLLRD